MAELTNEKAIEHYTELMRRIQVGAYEERDHEGNFGEDGVEESVHNLDTWAAKQGLAFHISKVYVLEPMSAEELAAYQLAQEMNDAEAVAAAQTLADFPYCTVAETMLYQYHEKSGRFYIEVTIKHWQEGQGAANVLYRVWRGESGLLAMKVDISEVE